MQTFRSTMIAWCLGLLSLCAVSSNAQETASKPQSNPKPATGQATTAQAARPNPVLSPVEDQAGLSRVLLIGDSISMGYTLAVRNELKGVANVHRIPTNGGPTTNGIKNLKAWLGDKKWDVIHFNWGLHDLKYIQDDPSKLVDPKTEGSHPQVSLSDYEKNLRQLVSELKATGAKLIWCATTPVPEGSAGRIAGDEKNYNLVAARIMQSEGVAINDLHSYASSAKNIQRPANVHYENAGSEYLAKKVASEIRGVLSK